MDIAIACSKTLDCPTAVENKEKDKGRKSACTACDLQTPPAQTEENKSSRCDGQHTHRRMCFVSVQILCTAKKAHREAETTRGRERIGQFMFTDATQNFLTHLSAHRCATTTGVTSHERFFISCTFRASPMIPRTCCPFTRCTMFLIVITIPQFSDMRNLNV